MNNSQRDQNPIISRENFLMGLLNKIITEYKNLLALTRKTKPYKIVNIIELSSIPGETKFAIQISYKNTVIELSAADIISSNYALKDFSDYHAEMIRQAAQGKIIDFLKLSKKKESHKIISKLFDKNSQQYLFVIETPSGECIRRTAHEITTDKNLLQNLSFNDVYDVGYTQGGESIVKEKMSIMLITQKSD